LAAEADPARLVNELATLSYLPRALHAVAETGVADFIGDAGASVGEVAAKTRTDAGALARVLHFLATYGVFEEIDPGTFRATPLSEVLRTDHPESVRRSIRFYGLHWDGMAAMAHSLRTGEPGFPTATGLPYFAYLAADAARQRVFDDGMARLSAANDRAVVDAYDFAPFRLVVDVGGGRGGLVREILTRHAGARGVLFELPQALRDRPRLLVADLLDRCAVEAGDCFESVPRGGDCYVLKNVLHDHADDRCVRVLANCRAAMAPGGRVVVVDRFLPEVAAGPHPTAVLDMVMLVVFGGRERRRQEWDAIFAAAGLRVSRVLDTATELSIVEGVAAD
jgi:hypothetical protein